MTSPPSNPVRFLPFPTVSSKAFQGVLYTLELLLQASSKLLQKSRESQKSTFEVLQLLLPLLPPKPTLPMSSKPRPQDKKSGGFRLGPKLAKGTYQGHSPSPPLPAPPQLTPSLLAAQKIKATLIHKAKLKKSYHKDLAAEGYGDEGTGANGGELGVRRRKVVKPVHGAQRRGPEVEEEEGKEEEREEVQSEEESSEEDRKGKGRQRKPKGPAPRSQPPPRADALPMPVKRPRLTEEEVEKLREKKKGERREWGKKGARGQPKLGGRVEMLLGRIRKGME